MDIVKELKENRTVLVLIPGAGYNDTVIDVVGKLSGKGSVCYITTNKTYGSLKEIFSKKKVKLENIVFVDAITKTIKSAPDQTEGCYYVASPASLTEMAMLTGRLLNHGFDYVIFDSLTNLMIYQDKAPIVKFVSNLVNRIRDSRSSAVFYALSVDEQATLIKEAGMFVDRVVDLDKEKG